MNKAAANRFTASKVLEECLNPTPIPEDWDPSDPRAAEIGVKGIEALASLAQEIVNLQARVEEMERRGIPVA